jgi:phage/plasmid-like protein (TIGR03299 family)
MSDDIERFADGSAGFAGFREPAWHRLGTIFQERATTEQVLVMANMANWNVRLVETISLVEGKMVSVPDRFTVVRDNPVTKGQIDGLGNVGTRYTTVQNEQVFDFADALLAKNPDAQWDTAGSIRDGRTIFGCIKLPNSVKIGGVDAVDQYLMISSSHDGSSGVVSALTPIRVVCANTLRLAMQNATHSFKARHTASVEARIDEARIALALSQDYFEVFVNTAEQLADITVTDAKLDELIESVYPKPAPKSDESTAGLTIWDNRGKLIHQIWNGEADQNGLDTMSTIKGNGWGALNAISEAIDWYPLRSSGKMERAGGFSQHAENEKSRMASQLVKILLPETVEA